MVIVQFSQINNDMNMLILEDDNGRIDQFRKNLIGHKVITTDQAHECIDLLKEHEWDILFLDHDLGGEAFVNSDNKNTGAEVARFLNEHPKYKPEIVIVHSLNPVGAKLMTDLITGSRRIPYAWEMELD